MDLTTRRGEVLHIPPEWGNRVSIRACTGKKPMSAPSQRAMFVDLRRYREWLMTG